MRILQLNSHIWSSSPAFSSNFIASNSKTFFFRTQKPIKHLSFSIGKIRAVGTIPGSESVPNTATSSSSSSREEQEPPSIDFAFVHSVLLPDGTLDVQIRSASGGQKLRDIMLNSNVELYGPYARPLFNCGGGGTCGTCMVEFVEGKELLNPRTEKEKNILKKKPKTWRLACQTTVGKQDSRGQVVIQQLPEWKAHEWDYKKIKNDGLQPFSC